MPPKSDTDLTNPPNATAASEDTTEEISQAKAAVVTAAQNLQTSLKEHASALAHLESLQAGRDSKQTEGKEVSGGSSPREHAYDPFLFPSDSECPGDPPILRGLYEG